MTEDRNLCLLNNDTTKDLVLTNLKSRAFGDVIRILKILCPKCEILSAWESLAKAQAAAFMNHVQSPSIPPT